MANPSFRWIYGHTPDLRAPLTAVIEEFADLHNLRVRRHDKGGPTWSLCFAHPRGGRARIEVTYWVGDQFRAESRWWQDDYDSFSRQVRHSRGVEHGATTDALLRLLEREMNTVLAWSPDEWTEVVDGYEPLWSWFTKEEFERSGDGSRWPDPRH